MNSLVKILMIALLACFPILNSVANDLNNNSLNNPPTSKNATKQNATKQNEPKPAKYNLKNLSSQNSSKVESKSIKNSTPKNPKSTQNLSPSKKDKPTANLNKIPSKNSINKSPNQIGNGVPRDKSKTNKSTNTSPENNSKNTSPKKTSPQENLKSDHQDISKNIGKKIIAPASTIATLPGASESSKNIENTPQNNIDDKSKTENSPKDYDKSKKNIIEKQSNNTPPDTESIESIENNENEAQKPKKTNSRQDFVSEKLWKKFSSADIEVLQNINQSLIKRNFDEALILAKQLKTSSAEQKTSNKNMLADAVVDLILWHKYSNKIDLKKTSFRDISTFVMDNPYFPNINELRKNVEKIAIANNISYNLSEIYFNTNPALTTESKIFVVESKIEQIASKSDNIENKDSKSKVIQSEIAKIWVKENFSDDAEAQFLEKYRHILTENDYAQRIERLLWEGKKTEAIRIFNYIGEDYKILFDTILKFDFAPRYIDNLLLDVPRKLRSNELLTFKRLVWNKSRDNFDEVINILIDTPETFKYNDKWWSFRRLYGRELLKQGKYKKAYQILSKHNLPVNSSDFWEAEWTAGWVALRFLEEPKLALAHFSKMRANVFQPVTLSRAIYWEAMCYEAMNQKSKAITTYKEGTNYPIFFYGQLAIHKHKILDPLGSEKDIILPKSPEITGRDIAKISESRGAQIAYILAVSGDRDNATKIFEWLVNNAPTDGQIAVIMKIINEIGDKQLDARISRVASKKNVFFVREKFQIIREVMNDEYAPLVHAIIKQESGFAPSAVSRVGALGYMQLMPGTAKLVAKELGIRFEPKKLTRDIKYNIRLGSYYIKKLIDEFEGSEMLAIASYNAGPNATKRWINEFYDPRKQSNQDKIVDWIELITYSETRNYVQRIIENMIVYKYLMSRTNYDVVR